MVLANFIIGVWIFSSIVIPKILGIVLSSVGMGQSLNNSLSSEWESDITVRHQIHSVSSEENHVWILGISTTVILQHSIFQIGCSFHTRLWAWCIFICASTISSPDQNQMSRPCPASAWPHLLIPPNTPYCTSITGRHCVIFAFILYSPFDFAESNYRKFSFSIHLYFLFTFFLISVFNSVLFLVTRLTSFVVFVNVKRQNKDIIFLYKVFHHFYIPIS